MIGRTISHYKILEKLGEGGMGVVYKAEDTTLERSVALKFLAAHLLDDDEAKQRFLREAKAAAALDHPNICTVYEIAEAEGKTFLAMAFLKGETLEDRIAKGPLPLKDALDIGRQVAEGLQAAHAEGIVHRDIKPANILISPEGRATVMDFGLARLTEASRLTKAEQTVGTAAYMSPEQMQGAEVDHRTDIWALGCVLYEMVAGARPFKGEYVQALAYEIVNQASEPLTGIRAGVPMELEFVVGKCLAKDRDDRPESAQEVARELRTLAEKLKSGGSTILRTTMTGAAPAAAGLTLSPTEALPPEAMIVRRSSHRLLQALLAAATLSVLALAVIHFGQSPPSLPVVEFSMTGPEGLQTGEIALSPDGRHLVVSVSPPGSLWMRPLDSLEWRQLAGTDGSRYPFWSPDSDEIGFFADGRLKKVALAGGPEQTIAEAPSGRGGSWGADGTILLAPIATGGQIYSVPESGGEPVPVTEPADVGSPSRRFPHPLPDGRHFLFTDGSTAPDLAGVYMGSLDGESPRRLLPDISNAVYVPRDPQAGFVFFVRDDTLMSQPFNLSQLKFVGGPIPLAATTARSATTGFYQFSASESGFVAHATSSATVQRRLVWLDRTGTAVDRTTHAASNLRLPALSPAGDSVAYVASDDENFDVWTYDLNLGTRTRLSNNPGIDSNPVWSPDAANVAFSSQQGSTSHDIFLSPRDGSSPPVVLYSTEGSEAPQDWTRDGRFLLYGSMHPETVRDVWYLERTVAADGWEPHLFLNTAADEKYPRLSPDGRYVAYISDESGRSEIYVQPFPDGGRRTTVSTAGGDAPVWGRGGKELFYVDPDNTLVAVEVSTAGEFAIAGVVRLFQDPSLSIGTRGRQNYDVSLDGQRFLTTEPVNAQGDAAEAESSIQVIMNWRAKFAPEQ